MTLEGTLIGFDFGERRIGVAVGETGTRIANPLGAIDAQANDARFREIAKLVEEWHPCGFVVGRPRHADESEHAIAKLAEKFARRLHARYSVPVVMVDETLSSATAEASLRDSRAGAKRKSDVDAVAAAIILQAYLDDPKSGEHAAS
ncbi:MAG TPA: Holliday junction resolvase RuvX [Usitatibacter sp.]|nr:Holliday junction resolvase RuvX [Usitatibacter sp.]